MHRSASMSLLIALLAATAAAETYYVSADGKPTGDGSKSRPWPSVNHALSEAGGGHTIIVRPGIYVGAIRIQRSQAGTREAPTVIKAETKWKALVIGAAGHGISNADDCDWIVVDGFQVQGAYRDGVKMNGDHNLVRNCWVHHNGGMGIAMHGKTGGTIENNLVEFNGGHVQFDHGVYADGVGLTIRGNVVRHNACYGLHLYPSIRNSLVANNLVYGQVHKRGIIVVCPLGGGKNMIVNNTVLEQHEPLTLRNGRGDVVANNIFLAAKQVFAFEHTANVLVDYNLCTPKSDLQGPHGASGDPRFVDPAKGVFWLQAGSPAIGKGSSRYALPTDFWGRPRRKNDTPDLGAFEFVPSLAAGAARSGWYEGWPYYRAGKGAAPDFWALPPTERKE